MPSGFTFNFVPHLKYPVGSGKHRWGKDTTRRLLKKYHTFSLKRGVPIYIGEFGVNYRQGLFGEDRWLRDNLDCFEEYGFHWTYWTYKAVKNSCHPDGILSYYENPPWVNRGGPLMGWETYKNHWPKSKNDMIRSWRTPYFQDNTVILKILQKYAHKK